MSKINPSAALAISYHAYLVAVDQNDLNGIVVWGQLVLEDQAKLKLELVDPTGCKRLIASSREKIAKQREVQALG